MVQNFQKKSSCPVVKPRRERAYLSFGPGADLVSEDWLIGQFLPLGMTKRSTRAFIRSLGLPLIWLGNTVFVNLFQFQHAIATISRRGQNDFVAPGSEPVRRGKLPADAVTELTTAEREATWQPVLDEMNSAHRRNPYGGNDFKKSVEVALSPLLRTQIALKSPKPADETT